MLFPTEVSVTVQIVPLIAALALTVMLLHARQKIAFQKDSNTLEYGSPANDRHQFEVFTVEPRKADGIQGLVDGFRLGDRVETLIDVSLRSSCVVGTIVLKPPFQLHSLRSSSARSLLKRIRSRLATEDIIHLAGAGEIVVFVSKVKFRSSLDALAKSLSDEIQSEAAQFGKSGTNGPGVAMYPIDGYDAEALMDSARSAAMSIQITPRQWAA